MLGCVAEHPINRIDGLLPWNLRAELRCDKLFRGVNMAAALDVLKALGLAVVTLAVSVGLVMLLEPAVPMWIAFAPGFLLQYCVESFGISTTNRIATNSTLFFWWVLFWILLLVRRRRSRRP